MKLYNEDCYEAIKKIPDNSVDLVIIDPPYQYQTDGGGGIYGSKMKKYHTELAESKITKGFDFTIFDELIRVMKKVNIYIWCSKEQVKPIFNLFDKYNFTMITWHKTNPVPACSNKYLSDTEYCLHFREKGVKIYGSYETKRTFYVKPINIKDKKLYGHPTIKPLDITRNLIINSSQEGDTVLDCFMGSGTTGVAAKELNRHFIGIELNKEYYDVAVKRINGDNMQLTLF